MRRAIFGLLFALVGGCVALILSSSAAGASTGLLDGLDQSQTGQNSNSTDQQSDATATTKQLNLNVPISLLSPGSSSGDVDQSNDADTTVISANENRSDQSIDQTQQGSVEGSRDGDSSDLKQSQEAANSNETSQDSSAEATTYQANVNLPVAILSPGANSGDVDQSNEADTYVVSYNQNDSTQSVDQTQQGSVEGSDKGHDPCRCRDHGHDGKGHDGKGHDGNSKDDHKNRCGCDHKDRGHDDDHKGRGHGHDKGRCGCDNGDRGHLSQSQQAANSNETTQSSSAEATTEQANVNAPFSLFDLGHGRDGKHDPKGRCGCDHKGNDKDNRHGRPHGDHGKSGDVDQSNEADTYVASFNSNDTWQWIDQIQQGLVKG